MKSFIYRANVSLPSPVSERLEQWIQRVVGTFSRLGSLNPAGRPDDALAPRKRWMRGLRWLIRLLLPLIFLFPGLTLVQSSSHAASAPAVSRSGAATPPRHSVLALMLKPVHAVQVQQVAACSPFDGACLIGQMATSLSTSIFQAARPLLDGLQQQPENFLTQTPAPATYGNTQVITLVHWATGVVDAALALVVLLSAYFLMLGPQIGTQSSGLIQSFPRLLLAFIAAHSSLMICQWMIDFNNALCLEEIDLLHFTFLSDIILMLTRIFTSDPLHLVNLLFLFSTGLFLLGQLLVLIWQMLVRLATVTLLVVLSPLGLFALALPLFQRWGQLWLSAFTATVIMQFFQVTALVLGGLLVAYWDSANLLDFNNQLFISLLVSNAVFYLIIRLPGMLREFALRPTMTAGQGTSEALSGIIVRLAAAL